MELAPIRLRFEKVAAVYRCARPAELQPGRPEGLPYTAAI